MKQKPTHLERPSPSLVKKRMVVVAVFIGVGLMTSLGYSAYLQVFAGDDFTSAAEKNYIRTRTLLATRGEILDRNLQQLATSVDVYSLFADPADVDHPITVAAELSTILGVPAARLYKRLSSKKMFTYLKRHLTDTEYEAVKALDIPGLGFVKEQKRFYPKRKVAGQVLGMVGVDPKGLEGLELAFEDTLKGKAVSFPVVRNLTGKISMVNGLPNATSLKGSSVVLTIDVNIQAQVEQALEKGVVSSGASSGMAIVMRPSTGEILAMANYPFFNPNKYGAFDSWKWRNRTITHPFEPGSTFKVFTLAGAIEEGAVDLDDEWELNGGNLTFGEDTIHDTSDHGNLTTAGCIQHSSNVCIAKIGIAMGKQKLHDYIKAFGFGEKSGLGLPGESRGIVSSSDTWPDITLSNISFGQGVSVTAVQLVSALAALGNGGTLMRPMLVKHVMASTGEIVQSFSPTKVREVVSPETAAKVIDTMRLVVGPDGTGEKAYIPMYDVCGKTGTAAKVDPETKTYSEDKWVGSFFGLVPASDPGLAILVVIDEPTVAYYGGKVAAPVFKEIAEWTLKYLSIPPPVKGSVNVAKVEKVTYKELMAIKSLSDMDKELQAMGDDQAPVPPPGADVMVPDFTGLAMRDALRLAKKMQLSLLPVGQGFAVTQTIIPETWVPGGTTLMVEFSDDPELFGL